MDFIENGVFTYEKTILFILGSGIDNKHDFILTAQQIP